MNKRENNPINPEHYNRLSPEPKDVIHSWGLNFNLGNAVKYIARAGHKGDAAEDLRKAQQYLQFEIDALEAESKHLCNSCKYGCIAGCPATEEDIAFGNGRGGDNVVSCKKYKEDISHISFEEALKHIEQIEREKSKDTHIEEVMDKIRKSIRSDLGYAEENEPTATNFQSRAIRLYNAYLYRLSEISKEMQERRKTTSPMIGMCSKIKQEFVLREGFNPEEVLESMAKKLMEE